MSSFVKFTKDNCLYFGNIHIFVRLACEDGVQHFAIIQQMPVTPVEIQGVEITHIVKLMVMDKMLISML